jgi:hypothetical protein
MTFYLRNVLVLSLMSASSLQCAAPAATYTVVAYLSAQNQAPIGIVEGAPGLFYTLAGNVSSVTSKGVVTTLATFPDPPYIQQSAPGATASNGLLYSSVEQVINSGSGNAFSVATTAASEHTYSTQSIAPTIVGNLPGGELFGTAYNFSVEGNGLATISLNGSVTTIYQFPSTERLTLKPIYGSDGNYYGTSEPSSGGTAYLYQVTPAGVFSKVATLPFGITGFLGGGTVLQGTDGSFYGIQSTSPGCSSSNQHGGVYKLTPSGQYTLLHDFGVCTPGVVNSLIQGSDGKLYGSTQASVLFSLTTSGEYQVLFHTTNGNAQGVCQCTLVQASNGIIYGTALGGGPGGYGLIFALDAGLPAPIPQALQFSPQSGSAGTKVRIWGYHLLQASVTFNGVPSTGVSSSGPNYVWATVPTGASTGPITVTTPGGVSTTTGSFAVE